MWICSCALWNWTEQLQVLLNVTCNCIFMHNFLIFVNRLLAPNTGKYVCYSSIFFVFVSYNLIHIILISKKSWLRICATVKNFLSEEFFLMRIGSNKMTPSEPVATEGRERLVSSEYCISDLARVIVLSHSLLKTKRKSSWYNLAHFRTL